MTIAKIFGRVLLPVLLLLLVAGSSGTRTNAQVGLNDLFCPHVPTSEGMLNLEITPDATNTPNFTAGMIGTFELINGKVSGGIDWMPTRGGTSSVATSAPTNELGSQLITWWSQKNGRNTTVQITNASDNSGTHTPGGLLNVHVRIFNDECSEIINFCDVFTAFDTHVYDLRDFVANDGQKIPDLTDGEGFVVMTPVKNCDSHNPAFPETAIEHDFLSGNMYIADSHGYTYGTNMYARQAICTSGCTGILDGTAGAKLDNVLPVETYGLFNALTSVAGSDVVVMNFKDYYGPPYQPVPAFSVYDVLIVDNNEHASSCGVANFCFARLGINPNLPASQNLGPPLTGP